MFMFLPMQLHLQLIIERSDWSQLIIERSDWSQLIIERSDRSQLMIERSDWSLHTPGNSMHVCIVVVLCVFFCGGWEVYCLHIMVWIFKHILFSCQQFIFQDCVKSSVFFSSWFMTLLVQLKLARWLVGLEFDICHRTTMTFAWLLAV